MISMGDLASVVFRGKSGVILILAVYADESADQRHETVFTVGGFMGYPHMFEKAETKWSAYLRSKNLAYFKASEIERLDGEFDPLKLMMTPRAARTFGESVRYDLGQIIVEEKLGGISLSLDIKDFRKVLADHPEFRNYYETDDVCIYMYKHFVTHCIGMMKMEMPEYSLQLAFVFDAHTNWEKAEESYHSLKNNAAISSRLGSVTHADDKDTPALQMADLCAYESRIHTLRVMNQKEQRIEFKTMANKHAWYSFSMFREEQLLLHLEDARRDAAHEK